MDTLLLRGLSGADRIQAILRLLEPSAKGGHDHAVFGKPALRISERKAGVGKPRSAVLDFGFLWLRHAPRTDGF